MGKILAADHSIGEFIGGKCRGGVHMQDYSLNKNHVENPATPTSSLCLSLTFDPLEFRRRRL